MQIFDIIFERNLYQIMATRSTIVLAIVLVGLNLLSCTSGQSSIEGKWVRIGDDYAGMIISVRRLNNGFEGELIEAGDSYPKFLVGDIKWKDIVNVAEGEYRFRDLFKAGTYGTSSFREARMMVNGDTLNTRLLSQTRGEIGSNQVWIRLREGEK